MQLVLEFCDRGDLRDALEAGVFRLHSRTPTDASAANAAIIPAAAAATFGPRPLPASDAVAAAAAEPNPDPIDYLSVLETAADIARGMAHLHACNIVHLDLKVRGDDADITLYPMPFAAACLQQPPCPESPMSLEFLIPVNPRCHHQCQCPSGHLFRYPASPPHPSCVSPGTQRAAAE